MKKLLLLFIYLVSTKGFSLGGTIVGNGGGFAEMQAVFADHLLSDYLSAFPEYKDFQDKLLSTSLSPLTFREDCTYPNSSSGPAVLSSCLLYGEVKNELGERPLGLNSIGAWVFVVRWMEVYKSGDWAQLLDWGSRVFKESKLTQTDYPLTWKGHLIAEIHQWSLFVPLTGYSEAQTTLELKGNSLDFIPPLREATGCKGPIETQFRYFRVLSFSSEKLVAKGPLKWSCDGQNWEGDLYIQHLAGKGQEETKLSLRLLNRSSSSN